MLRLASERLLWSPEQVASLLPDEDEARTATAVARWCRQGRIKGAKKLPSGRWVIPAAWVRELLSNGGSLPAASSADEEQSGGSPPEGDPPEALPGLEEP